VGTHFWGRTPKIWEGKKRAKFGAISDNSISRISVEHKTRYQKPEKQVINYNPFHAGGKKMVNFGSPTKKSSSG